MIKRNNLKDDLNNHIIDNPKKFPFIARFWDIELSKENEFENAFVEFGFHQTKLDNSIPFYKPFSKIIELTKI